MKLLRMVIWLLLSMGGFKNISEFVLLVLLREMFLPF